MTIRTYPQQLTNDVVFLVIDCLFAYNAIIYIPSAGEIPNEVQNRRSTRDQMAARECYVVMLEMDDHL